MFETDACNRTHKSFITFGRNFFQMCSETNFKVHKWNGSQGNGRATVLHAVNDAVDAASALDAFAGVGAGNALQQVEQPARRATSATCH